MDWIAGLLQAGASLFTGFMQKDAASNAAAAQDAVGNRALDLQAKTLEQARNDSAPWMTAGRGALQQYLGEMGLSKTGADGKEFKSQFTETPGYAFAQEEGTKGVLQNAAALGTKNSGAALKALTKFRMGLASQEHGNYMARLGNLATGGGESTNRMNDYAASSANSQAATLGDMGTSRASGYLREANALSGGISGAARGLGFGLGKNQNALSWGG